jgi:uncharacterized protein YecE (DUF72 family)
MMSNRKPAARIGISGWRYAGWRGSFYPAGLAQRKELAYAAAQLNSIEINGSFYSLQRPSSYEHWARETPPDFEFSVKGPRFITHMLRLRKVDVALANFFASGVLALGHKLGPVLWQLPERSVFDAEVLGAFLSRLPQRMEAAAVLARGHDERLRDRSWTTVDVDRPMRHALEVRHASFATPEGYDLLREHNVALVQADSAGRWPSFSQLTSDFAYVRLHGGDELYVSGYRNDELDLWAQRIHDWLRGSDCPDGEGRDVYVYFDNDVKVHAPYDAMALARRLEAVDRGGGPQ